MESVPEGAFLIPCGSCRSSISWTTSFIKCEDQIQNSQLIKIQNTFFQILNNISYHPNTIWKEHRGEIETVNSQKMCVNYIFGFSFPVMAKKEYFLGKY